MGVAIRSKLRCSHFNTVRDLQLVDNLLQVVGLNLTGHDLHHLLADLADLLVLGIGGLSDLVGALLCETHAEQTQKVAVGGLHIHVSFDHGLRGKETSIPVRLEAQFHRFQHQLHSTAWLCVRSTKKLHPSLTKTSLLAALCLLRQLSVKVFMHRLYFQPT